MNEPDASKVGHLIDLQCGHTQKPSEVEATMFTAHLMEAGFMQGKGALGSPMRSLPGKASSSRGKEKPIKSPFHSESVMSSTSKKPKSKPANLTKL